MFFLLHFSLTDSSLYKVLSSYSDVDFFFLFVAVLLYLRNDYLNTYYGIFEKGQKEARPAKITTFNILVLNLFYFLWVYINVFFFISLHFNELHCIF